MFAIHLDNVWSAADPADDMRSLAVDFSHLLHACSLMIPTLWLILLTAKFERVYTAYSRFLFWLSVTLPVLMAVCVASPSLFADALVARLMVTPFILVGMAFSRWMARSDLSKRLTFRALVIEGAAFGASVALFLTGVL
jgi:hypothetical protein